MKTNLLEFNFSQLQEYFALIDEKPFRAKQIMRWIHQCGESDFAAMTDLAKTLRSKLELSATISAPALLCEKLSADGTRKWLLDVGSGNGIETVFIPEDDRGTLCVSSQVGCALDCSFCATGRQGFNRNLSCAEIIGQLWWANRALDPVKNDKRIISNVVLMGMGEPLANFENVVSALDVMLDDNAYGLSRRRVTVSTSGMVPQMDALRERCPVALAVSLHAPDDATRDRLIPLNKKYPLKELMAACLRYLERAPRDFITFEYVMIKDVNDSLEQAEKLVNLVRNIPCKFNLIPFNPFNNSGFERSSSLSVQRFRDVLQQAGLVVTVRRARGDDIAAACGQLAGSVQGRTARHAKNEIFSVGGKNA